MAEGVLSPTVGARRGRGALGAPVVPAAHPSSPQELSGGQPAPAVSGSPPLPEARARHGVPLHRPWTLPPQGLTVFHGAGNVARLSHYFLPRLLLEGKRVLFLDGANSADPRLLERFARERSVQFERFNRGIQIARAFTCFQLTELIARVPKFLADFAAEVVIVTAFPDLYFDEDVRDWNARVAFEQGLRNLSHVAAGLSRHDGGVKPPLPAPSAFRRTGRGGLCPPAIPASFDAAAPGAQRAPLPGRGEPRPCTHCSGGLRPPTAGEDTGATAPGVAIAVFSAAQDFAPPPARRQFFPKLCAAANEVWRFSLDAENRLKLIGERGLPSPAPPPADHPLPKGEGR